MNFTRVQNAKTGKVTDIITGVAGEDAEEWYTDLRKKITDLKFDDLKDAYTKDGQRTKARCYNSIESN